MIIYSWLTLIVAMVCSVLVLVLHQMGIPVRYDQSPWTGTMMILVLVNTFVWVLLLAKKLLKQYGENS